MKECSNDALRTLGILDQCKTETLGQFLAVLNNPNYSVDPCPRLDNATPSLHIHYRCFIATTSGSAPDLRVGILPHGVNHLSFPLASKVRFSRSVLKPILSSCRLYTGCHLSSKQVALRLFLEISGASSFDSV
jgi:hypothetical protein